MTVGRIAALIFALIFLLAGGWFLDLGISNTDDPDSPALQSYAAVFLVLAGVLFWRAQRARARRLSGGQIAALCMSQGEESPGSTEARCGVTPGGGDPRESATETHRRAHHGPFLGFDGRQG